MLIRIKAYNWFLYARELPEDKYGYHNIRILEAPLTLFVVSAQIANYEPDVPNGEPTLMCWHSDKRQKEGSYCYVTLDDISHCIYRTTSKSDILYLIDRNPEEVSLLPYQGV